jgi:xanthine dehydrogenase accessory factor
MKDIQSLLAAAEALSASGEEGVLVTLVRTIGSTYRRPGARMLVLPGCRTIGTISGGCLESAVARDAWAAARNTEKVVLEVDSAPEDDTWGHASGCHGKLFLLAERILPGQTHPALHALATVRAQHRPMVLCHMFSILPDEKLAPIAETVTERWEHEAAVTLANAASRWVEHRHHEKDVAAFLEFLAPPAHLIVCGAGDDAFPLAKIASELAWTVDVLDTRSRSATRDRFPTARNVRSGNSDALAELMNPHTAVVLMTHRFADDLEFLAALMGLSEKSAYIGILGPRRRTERLLAELESRGTRITPRQFQAIRSPVGLDLGSTSPETIALSIIAEIQAVMTARDAHPLSHRVGAIHPEQARSIEA